MVMNRDHIQSTGEPTLNNPKPPAGIITESEPLPVWESCVHGVCLCDAVGLQFLSPIGGDARPSRWPSGSLVSSGPRLARLTHAA